MVLCRLTKLRWSPPSPKLLTLAIRLYTTKTNHHTITKIKNTVKCSELKSEGMLCVLEKITQPAAREQEDFMEENYISAEPLM